MQLVSIHTLGEISTQTQGLFCEYLQPEQNNLLVVGVDEYKPATP